MQNKPEGLEKLTMDWESAPIAVEPPKVYLGPSSESKRGAVRSTSFYEDQTKELEPAILQRGNLAKAELSTTVLAMAEPQR